MNAAELGGVTVFRGGEKLLDSVSLAVPERELWVLAGSEPACPRVALRVLAGRVRPDLGSALVFGQPARENRHELGFVSRGLPSRPALLHALLRVRGALRRCDRAGAPCRVACVLDALGVGFAQKPIGELSSLEMRKVLIAAALLDEPAVLCVEEPLDHLGSAGRPELIDGLMAVREASRTTLVCSAAEPAALGSATDSFAVFDGPVLRRVVRSSQLKFEMGERLWLRTADLARDFVLLSRALPHARLVIERDAARKSQSILVEGADEVALGVALKRAKATVLELRHESLSLEERLGLGRFRG